MMKPTIKHTITKCGLLVVSSLLLSGCFELNFPDTQSYYNAFNNSLSTIKTDENGLTSSMTDYSIEEYIFNDDTVNTLQKAKTLSADYYEYLAVCASEEMLIEDCAIYVKCEEQVDFTLRIFIKDNLPEPANVRAFNQPSINPETKEEIPYADRYEFPNYEGKLSIVQNDWTSFYIENWSVNSINSKTIKINKGQFMIFQILNNTGYGADLKLKPIRFTPVNVIISPASEK